MMTPVQATQRGRWLLALVGLLDLVSGLALVSLPHVVLRWAGLIVPAADGLVYCRFLGAMVAAVGGCCWLALRNPAALRAGLDFTRPFRAAAGGFVVVALFNGWLQGPWAIVAVADFTLWVVQTGLLRAGAGA